jgi:O-antigen/teichoic acid export membrane protein
MPAEMLARLAREGWIVNMLARGGGQIIRFASMVVLARLLAPADFGVLAMSFAIIGVAEVFKDLGLSAATIRAPAITSSQINSLFWLNAALGLLMTLGAILIAPTLGPLYDDARIPHAAAALALSFAISGLGVQHGALLQRELRFRELAACQLLAALIGGLASIAGALLGYGYWALIGGLLISSATSTVLRWHYCRWRPAKPAYDRSVNSMVSFGGYLVVFSILGFLAHNLHIALIGWMWGAATVGLFSRAYLLYAIPLGYITEPINMVAQSTLSRLATNPTGFRDYYLRTTNSLITLAAPASVATVLWSDGLVQLLLGPKWSEAANFLRWFAIGMVPQVICYTSGWLYLVRGDSRMMMLWGIGGWSFLIVCLLAGLSQGLESVAISYAAAMYALLLPCMALAFRNTPLRLRDLLGVTLRPVAAAVLAGAALSFLPAHWELHWQPLQLSLNLGLYALLYLLLLSYVFGQRQALQELTRLLAMMRKKPL